jgi:hypothetical protein
MPAISKEIKYGEDNPIELAPELTEEELDIIRQKQEALDKLLAEKGVAKYKIDLNLGRGFSVRKASHGALSFWESGKKFHGGGDTKLYICAGKMKGVNECEGFLPDTSQGYGFGFCPKCKNLWPAAEMAGEVFARLYPQGWATLILRYFVRLEMNADIRIKMLKADRMSSDIRYNAEQEQERQRGGEVLAVARSRVTRIYTLSSIIKDTAAGADLQARILAFVQS